MDAALSAQSLKLLTLMRPPVNPLRKSTVIELVFCPDVITALVGTFQSYPIAPVTGFTN
ncbi:MAG: hypothetical protein R2847_10575 [Bacteroidia bacterium]